MATNADCFCQLLVNLDHALWSTDIRVSFDGVIRDTQVMSGKFKLPPNNIGITNVLIYHALLQLDYTLVDKVRILVHDRELKKMRWLNKALKLGTHAGAATETELFDIAKLFKRIEFVRFDGIANFEIRKLTNAVARID